MPRHATKKHYLFDGGVTRFSAAEVTDGLQLDDVGEYSTTAAPVAQRISELIANLFSAAERARGIAVTDGCACCGGNVISFARCGFFCKVSAVEFDPKRFEMLRSNVQFALRGVASPPATDVRCGSYLDLLHTLKQDVVFLDPPWGGVGYKKESHVPLFLGDRHLADIVHDLRKGAVRSGTKCVVLKVPCNFHVVDMRTRLKLPVILLAKLKKMDLYVIRFPANDPVAAAAAAAALVAAPARKRRAADDVDDTPGAKRPRPSSAADGPSPAASASASGSASDAGSSSSSVAATAAASSSSSSSSSSSTAASRISMHLMVASGRPTPESNGMMYIEGEAGLSSSAVADAIRADHASRARDHATTVLTVDGYTRDPLPSASMASTEVHCSVPAGEDATTCRDLRKYRQFAAYLHARKKIAKLAVKYSTLRLHLTSDDGTTLRLHVQLS